MTKQDIFYDLSEQASLINQTERLLLSLRAGQKELINKALDSQAPVRMVATATGLTEGRIYQIRKEVTNGRM